MSLQIDICFGVEGSIGSGGNVSSCISILVDSRDKLHMVGKFLAKFLVVVY